MALPTRRALKLVITSTYAAGVERAQEPVLRPTGVPAMGTNLGDLLLVAVDTPESTNIVSVDEASRILFLAGESIAQG